MLTEGVCYGWASPCGLQQHSALRPRIKKTPMPWQRRPAATGALAPQAAHEAALAELGEAVAAGEARAAALQARLSAEAAERDDALAALRADVDAQRERAAELEAALGDAVASISALWFSQACACCVSARPHARWTAYDAGKSRASHAASPGLRVPARADAHARALTVLMLL